MRCKGSECEKPSEDFECWQCEDNDCEVPPGYCPECFMPVEEGHHGGCPNAVEVVK